MDHRPHQEGQLPGLRPLQPGAGFGEAPGGRGVRCWIWPEGGVGRRLVAPLVTFEKELRSYESI